MNDDTNVFYAPTNEAVKPLILGVKIVHDAHLGKLSGRKTINFEVSALYSTPIDQTIDCIYKTVYFL